MVLCVASHTHEMHVCGIQTQFVIAEIKIKMNFKM